MKPLGILGLLLVIAGVIVLAMGGVAYVKDRDTTNIGPVRLTTQTHGYITPLAGAVALGLGVLLLVTGRERRA